MSLAAINDLISSRMLLLSNAYFRAMRSPIERYLESGGQTQLPTSRKKTDRQVFLSYSQVKSMVHEDTQAMSSDNEHTHNEPEKKVALIFVDDVMTKHGAACTLSTQRVIRQIQKAEADPDVISILFYLDSPGGSVWGNRQLAMAIRNATKPTIGFISELACSACFWIAQQTNYLIADIHAICRIGSVGVIGIYSEESEKDKKEGIKRHVFTDDESTEKKVGNDAEPFSDEDCNKLISEMNNIKGSFVSDILNGPRGHLIQDEKYMRTAVVVGAKEALKLGWIDAEGTFQDAVDKCFELGNATDTSQNSPSGLEGKNSKISTMKFKRLASLFNKGKEDIKVSFDNEDQAKTVEDALVEYQAQVTDLTNQLDDANAAKSKAQTDLATANARIKELEDMDAAEPTTSDDLEGFNPNTDNQAVQEIPFVDL
ncbi:hypothetical protein BKI52_12475 [marine bacterium AO1-C]|nr:hypothetical protein BKI52_12475 [marine bacterium AO1-C]